MIEYRFGPWEIWHDPPPIPTRDFDWRYWHKDDDGAPDGSTARSGCAASLEACLAEIAEVVDELCYDCRDCTAVSLDECMATDCPFRFKLVTPLDRYAADMAAVMKPLLEEGAVP